jgi:hypothetical protein
MLNLLYYILLNLAAIPLMYWISHVISENKEGES